MSKKNVRTMAELNKRLNKMLLEVLNKKDNEVANAIKITESDMVEQEVYAKYTPNEGDPWVYQRRKTSGGLADVRNMEHIVNEVGKGVRMFVYNTTTSDGDTMQKIPLAPLVEGGDGTRGLEYTYKQNRSGDADKYLGARPFQAETIKQLLRDKEHLYALRSELERVGLNARILK